MKISWILTLLILLTAAGYHQFSHYADESLRARVQAVRAAVVAAGLDPQAAARGEMVITPREGDAAGPAAREARASEVKLLGQELIGFALEMKALEGKRRPTDQATQQRIMKIMERFLDLDAGELRLVIDELKTTAALDAKTKGELFGMSMMMLAQTDPEAAMRLFAETRSVLEGQEGMAKQMAGMCLSGWAAKDPAAALAWMGKAENADLVTDDTRRMALAGMARKDPVLALHSLFTGSPSAMDNAERNSAQMIAQAALPENRSALLAAVAALKPDPALNPKEQVTARKRAYDLQETILSGIGSHLGQGTFAESVTWIESAPLSKEQRAKVIDGAAGALYGKDPSPWLDWIGKNVEDRTKLTELTQRIVPQWTQRDFNAVGEWINAQPGGAMRTTATRSFAETLSPHEPESAARWALTIPDSPERTTLLKKIVVQWNSKDEAAAAAFASEHGIEKQ